MFSWADVPDLRNPKRCMAHLRKNVITPRNYGFGKNKWNLTELIMEKDQRARVCMMILHGCLTDGKGPSLGYEFHDDDGNPFRFRMEVLTRQACKWDKDGNRIWNNERGKESVGSFSDVVAHCDDKPIPGDFVAFKDVPLIVDEEGEPIGSEERMNLASMGQPIHRMRRFVVDDDLCISIPNPFAQMALERNGYKLLNKPEFHKGFRQRGITNWWFREVPRDFHKERKTNEQTKNSR